MDEDYFRPGWYNCIDESDTENLLLLLERNGFSIYVIEGLQAKNIQLFFSGAEASGIYAPENYYREALGVEYTGYEKFDSVKSLDAFIDIATYQISQKRQPRIAIVWKDVNTIVENELEHFLYASWTLMSAGPRFRNYMEIFAPQCKNLSWELFLLGRGGGFRKVISPHTKIIID